MTQYLDFEKPLAEIEGKAEELRALARSNEEMDITDEARALDKNATAAPNSSGCPMRPAGTLLTVSLNAGLAAIRFFIRSVLV